MKTFTIIVVIQDRTLKVSSDGTKEGTVFEGLVGDVEKATAIANLGLTVPMGVESMSAIPLVKAGYTPIGLAAAMMGVAPQSSYFWRAPKEVEELMNSFAREKLIISKENQDV